MSRPKKDIECDLNALLAKMNEYQNISKACFEFGLETIQLYHFLGHHGKFLKKEFFAEKIDTPKPIFTKLGKIRKATIKLDLNKVLKMLNSTQNYQMTCVNLGVSESTINNHFKRQGYQLRRRYFIEKIDD